MNTISDFQQTQSDIKAITHWISRLSEIERQVLQRLLTSQSDPMLKPIDPERVAYANSGAKTLTPREKQIMALIIRGMTNKEIANYLNISHRTVEGHRGRVTLKMGSRNAADLCQLCLAIGYARHV